MSARLFQAPDIAMVETLRIYSVRLDYGALAHVEWLRNRIANLPRSRFILSFEMWKLNWRTGVAVNLATAPQQAMTSDVLVIASASLEIGKLNLSQWLEESVPAPGSRGPKLLVGLFGDERNQAGELEWVVGELAAFARRFGMEFLWQWMVSEGMGDTTWLALAIDELLNHRRMELQMP